MPETTKLRIVWARKGQHRRLDLKAFDTLESGLPLKRTSAAVSTPMRARSTREADCSAEPDLKIALKVHVSCATHLYLISFDLHQ